MRPPVPGVGCPHPNAGGANSHAPSGSRWGRHPKPVISGGSSCHGNPQAFSIDTRRLRGEQVNFQELQAALHQFWAAQGCLILQPYDVEKGAGTMSPHTFLRALGSEPWAVAYVEPCRRPGDGLTAQQGINGGT